MSSAQQPDRIFGICELLENVLICLPMRELLLSAQLVSKEWKQVIDTSPSIQQRLFLRSRRDSTEEAENTVPLQINLAESLSEEDVTRACSELSSKLTHEQPHFTGPAQLPTAITSPSRTIINPIWTRCTSSPCFPRPATDEPIQLPNLHLAIARCDQLPATPCPTAAKQHLSSTLSRALLCPSSPQTGHLALAVPRCSCAFILHMGALSRLLDASIAALFPVRPSFWGMQMAHPPVTAVSFHGQGLGHEARFLVNNKGVTVGEVVERAINLVRMQTVPTKRSVELGVYDALKSKFGGLVGEVGRVCGPEVDAEVESDGVDMSRDLGWMKGRERNVSVMVRVADPSNTSRRSCWSNLPPDLDGLVRRALAIE